MSSLDNSSWEIFVPTTINDKPIRTRFHRVWDDKVRQITGGLTILHPTINGYWLDSDGVLFAERTIPVLIKCSEAEIAQIADMTAKYYRQKAIFFQKVSSDARIWHYDENFKRKESEDASRSRTNVEAGPERG